MWVVQYAVMSNDPREILLQKDKYHGRKFGSGIFFMHDKTLTFSSAHLLFSSAHLLFSSAHLLFSSAHLLFSSAHLLLHSEKHCAKNCKSYVCAKEIKRIKFGKNKEIVLKNAKNI
jgi:hypothetical protein